MRAGWRTGMPSASAASRKELRLPRAVRGHVDDGHFLAGVGQTLRSTFSPKAAWPISAILMLPLLLLDRAGGPVGFSLTRQILTRLRRGRLQRLHPLQRRRMGVLEEHVERDAE